MKWQGRRQSGNMEDRRGMSSTGKIAAGGGIIGIVILLLQLFGGETGRQLVPFLQLFEEGGQPATEQVATRELTKEEQRTGEFVATVLADTEDVWHDLFRQNRLGDYQEPKMVLFTEAVSTACGNATSAAGPFYCPSDQKVYMDLAFFEELKSRFGAEGGEFAIAYVIAHEIGHHVQTLSGTIQKVSKLQQQTNKREANKLSVALELQADFYAGVWAHHNQKYLEEGDIEQALDAANAVGDDAIQKRVQGSVNPDTFTHGTSQQRKHWFTKGFKSGKLSEGDTFSELLD